MTKKEFKMRLMLLGWHQYNNNLKKVQNGSVAQSSVITFIQNPTKFVCVLYISDKGWTDFNNYESCFNRIKAENL